MSGADRLEDGFPHGTREGYDQGCKGGWCPAGEEHGLSCSRARQLAAGDYRYQKLARQGLTPGAIADELGLNPEVHEPLVVRVAGHMGDEPMDKREPKMSKPKTKPVPTPKGVAPKPTPVSDPVAAPSQGAVRAWARANGVEVNSRGSVRASVMEAYRAAHEAQRDEVPLEVVNVVAAAEEPLQDGMTLSDAIDAVERARATAVRLEQELARVEGELSAAHVAVTVLLEKWDREATENRRLRVELVAMGAAYTALYRTGKELVTAKLRSARERRRMWGGR